MSTDILDLSEEEAVDDMIDYGVANPILCGYALLTLREMGVPEEEIKRRAALALSNVLEAYSAAEARRAWREL